MSRELERVLYVEDEEDIRRLVVMALQTLGGLTVTTCASGEEAIAVAPMVAPDIVLLDVMMPVLDGPGTLRRLRELPGLAAVPVVFMTAKVQDSEIAALKALGALDVIAKPFDALTLADTLKAIWRTVPGAVVAPPPDAVDDARSSQAFAAKMVALKQRFEQELPERLQELQRDWAGLAANFNRDDLEALHVGAHNLAGAGSTFGYHAITQAARALDTLLKALRAQQTEADAAQWRELVTLYLALERELQRQLNTRGG